MYGCAAPRRCGKLKRAISNRLSAKGESQKQKMITRRRPEPSATLPTLSFAILSLLCTAVALAPALRAAGTQPASMEPAKPADPNPPRVSADRTGVLETKDGLTLRLTTDLGSVRIVPLEAGVSAAVRYSVHIETDARGKLGERLLDHYSLTAKATSAGVDINGTLPPQIARASATGAQFWVQFEIAVPRGYNVDVNTEAGDIETQDIGGIANLATQGGNIRTGRLGFNLLHAAAAARTVAKLETGGGHIQVQDVSGDLNAFTAGGHILAGNIGGDAELRSGGGHIRAGQIGGRADLETNGGNITVGQAGSLVTVKTGGGQIDFGEVRGSVRAQTGGGGIRIMYVSGPMEVESSAGSICLTRVAGAVRAATAGGTITAWINPDSLSAHGTVHLPGASQLSSGRGDIVVFLPRNLAADLDAIVESGGEHHIEADPELALAIQSAKPGSGLVHATAVLNGGGAPLRLRTTAGTIHLKFLDSETALRDSLIREQKERLTERLNTFPMIPANFGLPGVQPASDPAVVPEEKGDWIDNWLDRLQVAFLGGIREDPDEFKKRLVNSPPPAYPQIARRAGLQGVVKLQVRTTQDGRVEVQKMLEGEPALADAAIAAVKRWRVKPVWINGRQVDVISTVTFNFQLR